MHIVSLSLAFCVCLTVVYCLPNGQTYKNADDIYLELARELADELIEEKSIQDAGQPSYEDSEEDYLENAKGMIPQAKKSNERENNPPYVDTHDMNLQLAREVADQYMEERRRNSKESESAVGARTASGALRAFNRPNERTKRIAEKLERENAELEALLMIASGENSDMLRQLHNIDLTARRARPDPTCDISVDCNEKENKNFVDGFEFRTTDGSCNNLKNYTWGMAGTQHRRLLPAAYSNGKWGIRTFSVNSTRRTKVELPSARHVSNAVHNSPDVKPDNQNDVSLALFYFMQFIDHDLAKTPEGEVGKTKCCELDKQKGYCLPIKVGDHDDHFKPGYCMDGRRSFTLFRCNDNTKFQNQINELTAYCDGSMVYGSSKEEEKRLRTFTGGLLKESTKNFMPNSTRPSELMCRTTPPELCFEAGDVRSNVHPGLTSYHTIFVRQHNRIAEQFGEMRRKWTDERIYQETRKIVGAQIQHTVYNEMLPILIAKSDLDKYGVTTPYSYDDSIDASMTQGFNMAFRFHTLMPDALHLAEVEDNNVRNFEQFKQEEAFLKPQFLTRHNYFGMHEVALGMAKSSCPFVNRLMNNATRNLLFLDEDGNSIDLVALNIMRLREWGMPPYTEFRALCGLGNATTFDDLLNTTKAEDVQKMKSVYANVRDIDLWVGLVTETNVSGTISGATQSCLLAKHFANLKQGDRFWYESSVAFAKNKQINEIKQKTTLARIMCANLNVPRMKSNVFRTNSGWESCQDIMVDGELDLSSWPK